MNKDQFLGTVRAVCMFGSGILISGGYLTSGNQTEVIGAVIAVASLIWTLMENRKAKTIAKAAAISNVSAVVLADGSSVVNRGDGTEKLSPMQTKQVI